MISYIFLTQINWYYKKKSKEDSTYSAGLKMIISRINEKSIIISTKWEILKQSNIRDFETDQIYAENECSDHKETMWVHWKQVRLK